MENGFLLAQILGFFAMCISIFSWQIKNPRNIIIAYIPSSSLWSIHYIILGAPIGTLMNFLSVIKDSSLTFIHNKHVPYIISAFLVGLWSIGLYFFTAWYDILPLIAGTILNITLLQRKNRALISRGTICSQICWITYNLIVGAYMGVACALLVTISAIIGMARHEEWKIGSCYRTFAPSIVRALFNFQNFKIYS